MFTRAKFRCISVEKYMGGKYDDAGKYVNGILFNYKFSAVVDGSPENKSFYAATPNGNVQLSAVKDDLFEIGKEYYLDFTPAA